MDLFYILLFLAGIGLSLSLAPLGCFLLWRRQAFFGDTLAHSALLGVGVALSFKILPFIGVFVLCLVISGILVFGPKIFSLSSDTWLGLLSTTLFSLGLILLHSTPYKLNQAESYLFGDILAIGIIDITFLFVSCICVWFFLLLFKKQFLLITIDPDWALVEGISVNRYEFIFLFLLSMTISTALPLVGVLLVPGLLLLPASSAFQLSHTPEGMIVRSIIFALIMMGMGIPISFYLNWPSGPTIVVTGFLVFIVSRLIKGRL